MKRSRYKKKNNKIKDIELNDENIELFILNDELPQTEIEPKLQDILNDLEYDKVLVKSIDSGEKYLNEFTEWRFSTVCTPNLTKIKVITFYSRWHWNEQIYESLLDIRKRCMEKYGYDIIPIDFDMGVIFGFTIGNSPNGIHSNISQHQINTIKHIYKKAGIKLKYAMCVNDGQIMTLIKNEIYHGLTRKQKRYEGYLYKKFLKKKWGHIEAFTYYEIK